MDVRSSMPDPTKLSARRKNVKPDMQRKLLKRAFVDILNVSSTNILYSLIENESFRFESTFADNHHKAILYVDGQIFEVHSTNKKTARDLVAKKALKHLFPDIVQELEENSSFINEVPSVQIDPAAIKLSKLHIRETQNGTSVKRLKTEEHANITSNKFKKIANQLPTKNDTPSTTKSIRLKPGLKPSTVEKLVTRALGIINMDNPNTVTALYSLFDKEAFNFDVRMIGNVSHIEYEATLSIGEKLYKATGESIKKSRHKVTIIALEDLFPELVNNYKTVYKRTNNIQKTNDRDKSKTAHITDDSSADLKISNASQDTGDTIEVVTMPRGWLQKRFSDFIANLVQNKYNEVVNAEPEHFQKYCVLSSIVMIQNENFDTATVICVSTGNKCVQGDLVSIRGDVLFDCHAEILSKRCLISFLYDQLSRFINNESDTILEKSINGRCRVKNGIKFYLYISSAPCGDGRVFTFSPPKNPFSKKLIEKRGILRVKPESGMGGIPVTDFSSTVPTYKDYLHGKPFVIMCCSAKLLRCNVLGTQGALLSHFLEPVYFDGIVIGDLFDQGNVTRALYDRLSITSYKIPTPYRLNKPFIEGITDSKICTNIKASKSSMNWLVHDPKAEFLCTKTGKLIDGNMSRLCKLNMFVNFKKILNMYDGIPYSKHTGSVSYRTYKLNSSPYQELKYAFITLLENNGRGKWVSKTKELDEFYIDADSDKTENIISYSPSS